MQFLCATQTANTAIVSTTFIWFGVWWWFFSIFIEMTKMQAYGIRQSFIFRVSIGWRECISRNEQRDSLCLGVETVYSFAAEWASRDNGDGDTTILYSSGTSPIFMDIISYYIMWGWGGACNRVSIKIRFCAKRDNHISSVVSCMLPT